MKSVKIYPLEFARTPFLLLLSIALLVGMNGCKSGNSTVVKQEEEHDSGEAYFELLTSEKTGLDFTNVLEQSPEFNVFNYMYFFNGGGLSAGDFNNDGLVDLYFTSNMGPNKMFLNEGEMSFRDVSEKAGVTGIGGWSSGVSVVDINNDGMLDLYVSQIGDYQTIKGENLLLVCQKIEDGVPVYENQAYQYGLNSAVFGTQVTFFDYDRDGDLDMYQLNHSLHANGTFGQRKVFQGTIHPTSGDKLYQNDNGLFRDVTETAGINSYVIGYGLGVVTGDINQDGWTDIYVGNDFHENDYLYINQKDGTFKEVLTEQIRHTSRFSMGVDIADINNDAQNDIFSLDMLPYDPIIQKASLGEDAYSAFNFKLGYGYNHQFSRNNLQLNNGDGTFTEIGMFAGVHATDWSWAVLMNDFDHDGYKDIFISNGIPRRMNDIDYVNFRSNNDLRWKQNTNNLEEDDLSMVDKMPQIKLPNKFYRNQGDLTFQDLDAFVKNNKESYSNGAVWADFDNDGDLDYAVNNIDDNPFVYENKLTERDSINSFISLTLKGSKDNILGIGARLIVRKGEETLSQEHFLVRGYQSSVAPGLHLGVGNAEEVDDILLIWPDGKYQHLGKDIFNKTTEVSYDASLPDFPFRSLQQARTSSTNFKDVTAAAQLEHMHDENSFVEFNRETLMPHMVSREGPAIAVADIDGDGREDFFVGGAKRKPAAIYYQKRNGTFKEKTPQAILDDAIMEDVDAKWVDVENDGDLDLVVASGGNEFWGTHEALRQRIYVNQGKGKFVSRKDAFGQTFMTASCVSVVDINKDGFMDLFFGGRAVPWKYGEIPQSYLFLNQRNGTYRDVTEEYAPELNKVGLVTEAQWADLDNDGDMDLVLAMEWETIKLFINEDGELKPKSPNNWKGWWNTIKVADFDGDGDLDILAGNTGKNNKLKPDDKNPVKMYVSDFDKNDKTDQLVTYHLNGKEVFFANYAELTQQLPGLKKKYLFAKDFARATPEELVGKEAFREASLLEANHFESVYLENTGALDFKLHELPDELQFSTINALEIADLDKDGQVEVLVGGNFYECNIEMGRYDANFGNVLRIKEGGIFELSNLGKVKLDGQVREIATISIKGKKTYIIAKNEDYLQLIRPE
ncbi:MAG: VCBS repeat-containing protein [Bacteroidota bacterium]